MSYDYDDYFSFSHMADFEGVEQRRALAKASKPFSNLVQALASTQTLYICGNGGLHFVGMHMATDLSRLVPHLAAFTFDNIGFLTSNANDHGYENIFTRWLEVTNARTTKGVLLGLSCSGKSGNILKAIEWGQANNLECFMISGKASEAVNSDSNICFNSRYYHTVEVATLMLAYDLVYELGSSCPEI